jgi:hypothetical protein
MPSLIFVRHVCDRCAEQIQIEMAPNVEAPAMPPGWHLVIVSGAASLLCGACIDGLRHWLAGAPPALQVIRS